MPTQQRAKKSNSTQQRAKNDAGARRPGNPGVFQGRRRELLLEHKAEYLSLRDNPHKIPMFWPRLYKAYFGEFPYHLSDFGPHLCLHPDILEKLDKELREAAEVLGIKQLKTFFYNLRTKATTVTANLWRDILLRALKSAQPKPRRDVPFRVYLREHRDEVVAEAKARWDALSESERKETPEIVMRNRVAREWLEAEGEDVKEQIREAIERSYEENLAEYERQQEGGWEDMEIDDEDMERYRDNLASVIEPLLEQIVILAGYTGASLIAAAPPATEDGDFETVAYHVGHTDRAHGNLKFDEWEKDKYEELWVRHYLSWNLLTSRKSTARARSGKGNDTSASEAGERHAPSARDNAEKSTDVGHGTSPSTTRTSSPRPSTPAATQQSASGLAPVIPQQHAPPPSASARAQPSAATSSSPSLASALNAVSAPSSTAGRRAHASARRSSTQKVPRTKNVNLDALELSDTETDEPGSPQVDDTSDLVEAEGADRGEGGGENTEDVGEMGIPKKDRKGRVLSTFLVARLKRMPRHERERLIKSFDRISDYEFEREDNIAKREALLRDLGIQDDAAALFASQQASGSASKRKRGDAHSAGSEENTPDRRGGADAPPPRRSARLSRTVESAHAMHDSPTSMTADDVQVEEDTNRSPHQGTAHREDQMDVDSGSPLADEAQVMGNSPREGREEVRKDLMAVSQVPAESQERGQGAVPLRACAAESQQDEGKPGSAGGGKMASMSPAARSSSAGRGALATEDTNIELTWETRALWPPWLKNAMDNIEKLSLDKIDAGVENRWAHLIRVWFELERASGFKGTTPLSSKKRPKDLGEWIARARSVTYAPKRPSSRADVGDWICDFQEAMWAWWMELNPSWRKGKKDDKLLKPKVHGDWSPLHRTGQNGLLSVLKGLSWLFEMEEKPKGSARWRVLFDDVEWAIEGLFNQFVDNAGTTEPPQKRRRL